jgi:antitoxin component YwqK of YwqJK toxin-antitoxin module
MIRNVVISVALLLSYCALNAQKHTDAKTQSASLQDVQLPFTASVTTSYPFLLQKNGTIQQQSSTGVSVFATVKQYKLHGKWQSKYGNGQMIDEGTLVKGIPHGEWKVWSQNGTLLAVRNYDADLLQRIQQEIKLNHPRNYFYTITNIHKKNSPAAATYLTANYSFGNTSVKQISTITEVVDNNANDITQYRPVFTTCLHHGLFMNFYRNGAIKDSGYFYQGLKEGVWLHYINEAGVVWKGSYKYGMPEREWKLYNAAGKLMMIVFYNQNGKEVWRRQL